MLEALPPDLARQSITHASWTEQRSDSYERLAFLGDSVLGLAVTTHLYPRLAAESHGAGRLTKIRAQAVSGRSCRRVAERLGLPERLRAAAPPDAGEAATNALVRTERVLASVIEAVIGACYLAYGYERTAAAVVDAFAPEIEQALVSPADFKSALQERLARRGAVVRYDVVAEDGPPHDRVFEVSASVAGEEVARGSGRSKKDAEQAAAASALESWGPDVHLRSISLKGFKSFPDRTQLEFTPGVSVVVGPNGSGKSNITDAVLWALGEQSPLAVRGQSMQDVIFAGAHGVQARAEAEVEVVLDNGDGAVDLPAGEVSIARRLDRAGEGEYRVNGAKCRLVDVLEILSDTGLGKEMHSVVSQGRVEQIVTSKPKDRRLLIEEAAGLGKHRKRRRRAQLKLERTQDNLDRALDVEREARARLRPLKRQAEAAELHERLARQTDEARWTLAREDARVAREELAAAEAEAVRARSEYEAIEAELAKLRAAREQAEAALAARGHEREALANRAYAARSAAERIGLRLEGARSAVALIEDRTQRRRALLAGLEAEMGEDEGDDDGGEERVAALEAELEQLAQDRHERLAQEVAELEARRSAAAEQCERLDAVASEALERRQAADAACDAARRARREVDAAAEKARREAAKVGAELAAVNQFLRSHAGAPGGAPALADALRAEPGYELALAAALGPRLRAAVAGTFSEASSLLDRAGRDGGAALVPAGDPRRPAASRRPALRRRRPTPSRCSRTSSSRTTAPRRRSRAACSPTCGSSKASTACGRTSTASR